MGELPIHPFTHFTAPHSPPYLSKMRLTVLLAPVIVFVALGAGARPITVWLAGDSTMAQKQPDKRPETGWGESFGRFFREGEVRIANRAMNGRSTRTFIS